jgi:hypothetical protein
MRADMSKVIVERPRFRRPKPAGSHYPRGHLKGLFERDLELAPQKLGIGFPHHEKWLNENLAPLRRWLCSQVGRPWWAVRSELRAVVDARSATQLHILQHVDDYVAEHVTMIGGAPHRLRWSGLQPIVGRGGVPLWVCPRSGILRAPPRKRRKAPRFGPAIRLSPRLELRTVDGVWRAVELRPLPAEPAARARLHDVLLGGPLLPRLFDAYKPHFDALFGRKDAYAVALRDPGLRERAHIQAGLGRVGQGRARR